MIHFAPSRPLWKELRWGWQWKSLWQADIPALPMEMDQKCSNDWDAVCLIMNLLFTWRGKQNILKLGSEQISQNTDEPVLDRVKHGDFYLFQSRNFDFCAWLTLIVQSLWKELGIYPCYKPAGWAELHFPELIRKCLGWCLEVNEPRVNQLLPMGVALPGSCCSP